MKARVLALFTHSFNILLLCVRVTMCRALFWQLSHHQTLQAPVELKGTCGWSKSPCFHALKGSQISLKVTLIPKGAGEEGGWILFPGSTWLCLQMRVEVPLCFRIIWAFISHSLLRYYSFRSQPEHNYFFFLPETPHSCRLMGFVLMPNPHKVMLLFQRKAHTSLIIQGYIY